MDTRQAFEAWAQTQLISTARGNMRSYVHGDAELAWDAWQAATLAERERAAKVCEEQRIGIDAFGGIDHHVAITRDQCAAAIRKG